MIACPDPDDENNYDDPYYCYGKSYRVEDDCPPNEYDTDPMYGY